MVYTQKNFVQEKWAILGQRMAFPQNSGSALRIFLKFCRMKGANRYMKILLVVFQEKNHLEQFDLFSLLGHFLLFDWLWSNWDRPLLIGSLNSRDIIFFMITTESLNSQNMLRILKQWRHISGKYLCDGHCMDVMWCLCVEVKIHGFVKLL